MGKLGNNRTAHITNPPNMIRTNPIKPIIIMFLRLNSDTVESPELSTPLPLPPLPPDLPSFLHVRELEGSSQIEHLNHSTSLLFLKR